MGKALDDRRKQEQLDAISDAVVNNGVKSGDVSQEDYMKYQGLEGTAKRNFAIGIATDMHERWQRQLQKSEIDLRGAEATKALAEAGGEGGLGFTPHTMTITPPGEKPFQVWAAGPKQWEITPESKPISPVAGQKEYDDTGKAIGFYDMVGRYHPYAKPGAAEVFQNLFGNGGGSGQGATFDVGGDRTSPPAAPAQTAPPPVTAGGPPRVASQADYAALPSGTVYIAPDGSKRRKP